MRDKIIHEYFGVNLQILWQTIEEDLPFLDAMINRIIADVEQSQEP